MRISLILSVFILPAIKVFAADEILFSRMTAPEIDVRSTRNGIPSLGSTIVAKEVGGLKCIKTTIVAPRAEPTFSCSLDSSELNAEAIYNSLDIEEEDGGVRDEHGMPALGSQS